MSLLIALGLFISIFFVARRIFRGHVRQVKEFVKELKDS